MKSPRIAITTFVAACILFASSTADAAKGFEQYKRIHQEIFDQILADDLAGARESIEERLERHDDDPENYYILAVIEMYEDNIEAAEAAMLTALKNGLPASRLFAGTLTALEPLRDREALAKHRPDHGVLHGPTLGNLTASSVDIWVRTEKEETVSAVASPSRSLSGDVVKASAKTKPDRDFTAIISLKNLKPDTEYFYRVTSENRTPEMPETFSFRTPNPKGTPARFRIGFGGGAGYVPQHEIMWQTILGYDPDAFLLLGDNVYIDRPEDPEVQHFTYYRRQSRPEFKRFAARTPIFSIWDDHDFSTNDSWGGSEIDTPEFKPKVFQVYKNNWPNPQYGGGDSNPGTYFDFYLNDVHFIMLDGRYYRTAPKAFGKLSGPRRKKGEPQSMLGAVQKKWLFDKLASSEGTFTVLCSPVPWVYESKGDSLDTWNGYKEERTEIFDYIRDNEIDHILLMSADRHRSDLWKFETSVPYPLYEFNSSRLTNLHVHQEMAAAEFSYNDLQSFGMVYFDTLANPPEVTYSIVNINGDEVFSQTVSADQLEKED